MNEMNQTSMHICSADCIPLEGRKPQYGVIVGIVRKDKRTDIYHTLSKCHQCKSKITSGDCPRLDETEQQNQLTGIKRAEKAAGFIGYPYN